MAPDAALRTKREEIVREHMDSENRHELDATMATFDHPRYELIATGEVYDGTAEVDRYFEETRTAFPDQRNELIQMHHADDAVLCEFWLLGTHGGPLRGFPPTGRAFKARMLAIFVFEEDRLVCERVYFDQNTILRQLGLAHEPTSVAGRVSTMATHPVTVARALGSSLLRR